MKPLRFRAEAAQEGRWRVAKAIGLVGLI